MKGMIVFIALIGLSLAGFPVCPPPEENGDVIQLPNPDDCSTFYKCLGLEPILMDCYPGLWFNPAENVCDYPGNIPEGICVPPRHKNSH